MAFTFQDPQPDEADTGTVMAVLLNDGRLASGRVYARPDGALVVRKQTRGGPAKLRRHEEGRT